MSVETLIADRTTLGHRLASDFEAEGKRALAARGTFTIALPGGSVASTFFPRLALLSFDWTRTEFFWTDERAVPPTDPESNYAAARSIWFEPAGVPDARIHRMLAEKTDLASAAHEYAEELRRIAGDPPCLDFVLLGVGSDGHVASLFPGRPMFSNERDLVAAVVDAPKPPPRRVTLTLPVLTGARRVVAAALGRSKGRAIHDALEHHESVLPVALVLRRSPRSLLLVDDEAAVGLAA
jgi:6-phosphogluconolactonase